MPRAVRLLVLPGLLFVAIAAATFGLAKAHLAKPETPTSGSVKLGDRSRGETLFMQRCAACHGPGGRGGGVGPRLAGSGISLAAAKAQIDNGGGIMPAGLVAGKQEQDVLAYLATIRGS